ncbi:hypothetical protein CI109_103050 [Kwoniella shandongensis]|uniref:Uncharacterized protein n=1 Tax=Kwoniella shandongensis TaxID=1734106 RepID=A0A5M6C9Y8_9TREE|nr:uncharacterized protein CI109_000241 [Kwoniella shandongensis]KAA5531400.1 hypothetical protein CI109_000241 [Kwoniella shandongensis]
MSDMDELASTRNDGSTPSPHKAINHSMVSSDPLAMSDNDFSPVRYTTGLATRSGQHTSSEEEEEERIEYGPRPSRSSQPLPPSDTGSTGSPHFDQGDRDHVEEPEDGLPTGMTTSTGEMIVVDVTGTHDHTPTSPQPRKKGEPMVVIPLLPLSKIYSYAHPSSSCVPTDWSRRKLPMISSASSSSRSSSVLPVRGRPKRQMSVSADSYGLDYEDAGEEDLEYDEDEDMESDSDEVDEVGQRRSTRKGKEREIPTRVSERIEMRRSFARRSSSFVSVISDDRYTSYRRAERRVMAPQTAVRGRGGLRKAARPTFTIESSEEDELQVISSDSVFEQNNYSEEDELDSDSDFDVGSDYKPKMSVAKKKVKGKSPERKSKVSDDVLWNHRPFCEKCARIPADDLLERALARKRKGGKKRKREDGVISDEELAESLEGWLECTKCVVSSHWGCLAANQKKEVLSMLLDREGPPAPGERPRRSVKIDEATEFTCSKCALNPKCFACHEEKIDMQKREGMHVDGDDKVIGLSKDDVEEAKDDKMDIDEKSPMKEEQEADQEDNPLFRCFRCKQCVHYEHLEVPASLRGKRLAEVADHYQRRTEGGDAWICHQCRAWIWTVDIIIAWRPLPADATEPPLEPDESASWKDPLPREYLVKWNGRGFRHVTWVPHTWLQTTGMAKLRNFLVKGPNLDVVTDETLAARGDDMEQPTIANVLQVEDTASGSSRPQKHGEQGKPDWVGTGPGPEPDARLPIEWSTIDRVLEVMLLPPGDYKKKSLDKNSRRILSPSASTSERSSPTPSGAGSAANRVEELRTELGLKEGIQPPQDMRVEIDEWERRTGRELQEGDVDELAGLVSWCFVKWDDLQYEQSCWDTPPLSSSPLYPAYKRALARFLGSRRVNIPVLSQEQCRRRDAEAARAFVPPQQQPDCVVGGKLMPFQMEGFQWLLYKYFRRESCILADDMGLGKTIQIASVLGYLGSDEHHIYPSLVIVPNSTITNWVREFEKWVPHVRVVPYYGEAASRKIISKYELYHKGMQGKAAGLKAHIVLTTYDMITGSEFRVFSNVPRWEVLCVDEGQRLKSDTNLIFNRLKTLNSVHRVLMTGTPLNNNLRELFNLLSFLDPDTFKNLWELEQRFENLNEGLIQELHEMIKPYILRRIKADVLKLPPKIEIIVPISLAPLQKQVYKGIFEKNADVIQAILRARQKKNRAGGQV